MIVKITVTGESGQSVHHEVDVPYDDGLLKEIGRSLDAFRVDTAESVFSCTINIDHTYLPSEFRAVVSAHKPG